MSKHHHVAYFFVIFLVVITYLSFLVVKPFITAALMSMILAYIFHPLFRFTKKVTKDRENLAATIVSILMVLIILVPLFSLSGIAVNEAQGLRDVFLETKQTVTEGDVLGLNCEENGGLGCGVSEILTGIFAKEDVKVQVENLVVKVSSWLIQAASSIFFAIPLMVLNVFIVFFITFYMLRDGTKFVHNVKRLLPLKDVHQREIVQRFGEMAHGLLYGQVVLAIIQGAIMAGAFALAGLASPILWGITVAILAFIPILGGALIWVPIVFILFFKGAIGPMFIVLSFGLINSFVDNVIKPKVIGGRASTHPVLVLLGVLGGIAFFGIPGFFIGPIILVLFITFVKIYKTEKDEITS